MIFHPPWGVHLLCVFTSPSWVALVNLNFGLHPAAATMNDMDVSSRKKLLTWLRLGCVVLAVAALLFVFSRINLVELAHALRSARPGWLLAAVAVYGLVFLPGAWRWHLMLRLSGCAVHPGATARMTLIGHFFYTVFFGVTGGDFAKSALYARWYQLPLPQILASTPLDRLLGLGGLILFIVLAFGFAALNGAFARLGSPSLNLPPRRMALILLLIALLCIALKRWGPRSALAVLQAFQQAGGRLLRSWPSTWQGLACGFLVQVALAASLALSLQAVSRSPVPWGHLLWTFPVISVASALPFNIAGVGLREGAVLGLFGLYGVSPADAVAASLLTLVARLFWAALGGILLWREQRGQSAHRPLPQTLSVVIPTFNDADFLRETVPTLRAMPEVCEIMVVDAGSQDGTRESAAQFGCHLLPAPDCAGQMRLGSAQPKGDVIILLAAGTRFPPQASRAVLNCLRDTHVVGGGFRKSLPADFPGQHGSRFKRFFRLPWNRRFLDGRLIFVRREALLAVGGLPYQPWMEGFEFRRRLRRLGRLALADGFVSERP